MATLKSLLVKLGVDSSGFDKGMNAAENKTSSSMKMISGAIAGISLVAIAQQVAKFTLEATKLSSRVETLGVVTEQLGKNAGYTTNQIRKLEKSIQDQGITTQASRQALAKMLQAQVDLTDATDLARLAQDAAVIAGTNSSEAFSRLIDVISSGNVLMARTMGLQVDFTAGYEKLAKQLGKTTDALTATEKAQSRASSVLEQGTQIAGTYEAAMGSVGKQLESTPRYIEEFTKALGDKFIPMLGEANKAFQEFLKTSTLLLNWENNISDALADHSRVLVKTGMSYEKYQKEMIRSLELGGKITKVEAELMRNEKDLSRLYNLLKNSVGELTNEKIQMAYADGLITERQALLLEGYRNQIFTVQNLSIENGILSESMFAVQRQIEGVYESVNRATPEIESLTRKLGIQAETVDSLASAFEGLAEKELRTLQIEAILAGDYSLATSIGEKIAAIESQEAALQDLIDLLDELDGRTITADVIINQGGGGALSTLSGKNGGYSAEGKVEAFGQTFKGAQIKNGLLYVRGELYSTNKVPGYASGADFKVPPGYSNDDFIMGVQSGERVQVTSAGSSSDSRTAGMTQQMMGQQVLDENKLARILRDLMLQVSD